MSSRTCVTRRGSITLANLTAQEYADRYESIYHLRKYADPTQEVSIVVPTTTDNPVSQTAEPVFRTADWHEREAFDLVGIDYEGHPDPRRILLPETWQGHPLSRGYDQEKPQLVTLSEHANPVQPDHHDDESDTMFLNIGPTIRPPTACSTSRRCWTARRSSMSIPTSAICTAARSRCASRGPTVTRSCPTRTAGTTSRRACSTSGPTRAAAEDLADIEVPEYAQVIRTMSAEMCRIAAHMLALATFALDVYGDFTAIFQYGMRDREVIQDILEDLTGQRLMFNYFRLGGVAWDLPEPREEFFEKTRDFLDGLPAKVDEYNDLLTGNEIFQIRTHDTGILEPEVAKQYGCTGPVARGSGIDYDLRRDDPYGYYENLEWDVVTEDGCDNYSRVLVRMQEVEESAKIIEQCLDLLEDWPEDERTVQSNVPRTLKPDADTEVYRAVEGAKGELGIYIRSDGTDKPGRFKIRSPCFHNLSALPEMAEGEYVPDLIASLGSLDIVLGEVDR